MIYLNKTDQHAIQFVSRFVFDNWIEQDDKGNFKYQNISYEAIKNPAHVFKQFFVAEQEGKCCYCCRSIKNDTNTELEHIIPRAKESVEEFERYYSFSKILRDNVVPQNDFVSAVVRLYPPPFPHHIAYHNILGSCNGRTFEQGENFTCCNRERKDDFIPPFNLMLNSVGYLPDGTIVYLNDLTNRGYFENLNLNKDILNKIRRLWYLFSLSNLTLDNIMDGQFTQTISEKITAFAIGLSNTPVDDLNLTETFSNENAWSVFKEYSFFFNYYRAN